MRRSSPIPDKTYPPLIVDPDRVLSLPVSLQGFQPIAWRNPSNWAWFKRRGFLSATFRISAGNLRLRWPDQINSISGSAKA
jgi:hypothetical protein